MQLSHASPLRTTKKFSEVMLRPSNPARPAMAAGFPFAHPPGKLR